jgi:hypothetical protein
VPHSDDNTVHRAIQQLDHLLHNQDILLKTDNTTTMVYLNSQGGPHQHLNSVTKSIIFHLKNIGSTIRAIHVPGLLNTLPDQLSRLNPSTEWTLHPTVFKRLNKVWGPYTIDLFASPDHHLLPRYATRYFDPKATFQDAFELPWNQEHAFMNPPFRLIHRILLQVLRTRAEATIIVPYWKSAPWFPLLKKITSKFVLLSPLAVIGENAEPLNNRKWKLIACKICGKNMPSIGTSKA